MSYPVWKCDGCGQETSVKPDSLTHRYCGGVYEETVHLTNGLNDTAVAILAENGFTPEEWARANYSPDGTWTGDRCGCSDNRCIGFHHHGEDDCGCLPVWIDEVRAGRG